MDGRDCTRRRPTGGYPAKSSWTLRKNGRSERIRTTYTAKKHEIDDNGMQQERAPKSAENKASETFFSVT